jgi:hypothetical protein
MGRGVGSSEEVWYRGTNVIHMCMEAMPGISLYNYLYLKTNKNTMPFLLSVMFSLQQNQRMRAEPVLPGSRGWGWGGEVGPNNVYICE